MVGEKFDIYSSHLCKNGLKLSTMVGENFGIDSSQLAKNALKLSTMVRENFGIYSCQLAKNALKLFDSGKLLISFPGYAKKIPGFSQGFHGSVATLANVLILSYV